MKKALVIIDYQNDFIDGALGFEKAKDTKEAIIKLASAFEGDIIFTLDTHDENYLSSKEGRNLPIKHCIKDTQGWQVPKELDPFLQKAKKVFIKNSFGSLEFALFLREQGYEVLEFCGLVSHICVFHNLILAHNALSEARLILHTNATASFDEELEKKAFDLLQAFWVELI